MVCEKCQSKLTKLAAPDAWQDRSKPAAGSGARVEATVAIGGGSSGGRPAGPQNMLLKHKASQLGKKTNRFNPIERQRTCRICKSKVTEDKHYCQQCAYQKGICAMCGKKMMDTSEYKMSAK
eukprot:TRINITY_DN4021_c0_g1_i1.p1 TRINITY_DN4021_c0_g1~~TRINITY_DN4021_c0_g1_i1.p1  ORF type:complete len:122 (-),score=30.58 TRINITY_DN4021_c0_g1_i1:102-467(-)